MPARKVGRPKKRTTRKSPAGKKRKAPAKGKRKPGAGGKRKAAGKGKRKPAGGKGKGKGKAAGAKGKGKRKLHVVRRLPKAMAHDLFERQEHAAHLRHFLAPLVRGRATSPF